jgi:Uma2 family endonuclease
MTTSTQLSIHQIQLTPGSSIVLTDVSWDQYQGFLEELGGDRVTRFAYNKGTLSIVMPSKLHEIVNRLLAKIIVALAEELGISLREMGSATVDRADLNRGIEPDSSFYIQNATQITGLNPTIPNNLPPDLAIEVDITHSSSNKLSIYQALGIPELWVFQQEMVSIQILSGSQYVERSHSRAFPTVTSTQINQWIQLLETADDIAVIRAVRAFVRNSGD